MRAVTLCAPDDFDGWRAAARSLAAAGVAPGEIAWQVGEGRTDLFAEAGTAPPADAPAFSVPRAFVALAQDAILHADPERFALLYALLVRLRAQPKLIEDGADPLLSRLDAMARAVRRDVHKMRAFLRFRELPEGEGGDEGGGAGGVRYVAWFEPEHHIVRANADFFVRRFTQMAWSILTPELCAHWNGTALAFAPGALRADAPDGDPLEETWKTYYAAIFNPARVKVGAMLKEMPKKYWKNMPETALVPGLLAGAQAREAGMIEASGAKRGDAPAPAEIGGNAAMAWAALRDEAAGCTRCPLWKPATQTVFGEGRADAPLMFVGEQPGDQEDLAGRPFVGPAGQVFDRALGDAGIARSAAYVTNAVKHFKFEPRGKRRIHAKPGGPEIDACRWWIDQERMLIRPAITVALGATAARSLLGRVVTIAKTRGVPQRLADGGECWVTVHPSYLLRIEDKVAAAQEYDRFVEDLKRAAARVAEMASAG